MRRVVPLLTFTALIVFHAVPVNAADGDGDQVDDAIDVCVDVADPFQGDFDNDGVGDLCEDAAGVTTFDGTAAGELIVGTEGADTLSGAGGNDALYGLAGDDTLDGGDGRDFLAGGPGVDTLTGGPGCDFFAFSPNGDDDVITDFDPTVDRLSFPAPGEEAAPDPLAAATFGGDDFLVVTFGAGDDAATLGFEGLPAGEQIEILTGVCFTPPVEEEVIPEDEEEEEEEPVVCTPLFDFDTGDSEPYEIDIPFDGIENYGTTGDDTLTGTECSDVIAGDAEIVFADPDGPPPDFDETECPEEGCGDDIINGLGGNDLLIGDKTQLIGFEVGGNDTIHGGGGDDFIAGDAAFIADCLCGGSGASAPGAIEAAVGGDDSLYGDDGNDIIIGDAILDLSGEAYGGNDLLEGGDGDDLLVGDATVILYGAVAGNDTLNGGDGDDVIYGDAYIGIDGASYAGEDTLTGGAGDDFLVGDTEFMDGQAASDTFVYDADSDFGDDIIADAGSREISDTIQFSGTGLTDIADLDARSTLVDDGLDIFATVFTDSGKTTTVGTITLWGHGFAPGPTTWADVDAGLVDIVIVP